MTCIFWDKHYNLRDFSRYFQGRNQKSDWGGDQDIRGVRQNYYPYKLSPSLGHPGSECSHNSKKFKTPQLGAKGDRVKKRERATIYKYLKVVHQNNVCVSAEQRTGYLKIIQTISFSLIQLFSLRFKLKRKKNCMGQIPSYFFPY